MPELSTQNSLILCKLQSAVGTAATSLSAATDAILVEDVPVINRGRRQIDNSPVTGALDTGVPLVVGAPTTFQIRTRLSGAGQTYTAGIKPMLDPLFQIAGHSATFTAAVAAAALTAGTTTSATLGTGFSTTAQAYRGMPLRFTAGGNVGRMPVVTDYTAGKVATLTDLFGSALSASDSVALDANWLYAPLSDRSAHKVGTLYRYKDGKLKQLIDCRASGQMQADAGGIGFITWTITGLFVSETDAAVPAGAVFQTGAPLFVEGALGDSFLANRIAADAASLSIDIGNDVQSNPSFNTASGFKGGSIVRRNTRWRIDPEDRLLADTDSIDWDALIAAGTAIPLLSRAGSGNGGRVFISTPAAVPLTDEEGDRNGIATRSVELKPSQGNLGALWCFA